MRIRASCDVISRTVLTGRVSAQHEGWTYTLVPNEGGLLAVAEIECAVPSPNLFYSTIVSTPERRVKATVIQRSDDHLLTKLRREFQLLESLLALQYGVSSIRWAAMRYELLFDSDAEREAATIYSWHSDRAVMDAIAEMDPDTFRELLNHKNRYGALAAPLSFYREGLDDYASLRFINSFFNFYFIFEGFYGGGKTRNYAVEEEMKKSADFTEAIAEALQDMKKICPETYEKLCADMKCPDQPAPDAIIEYFVSMRGKLHHFTNNPNRVEGTPFTHELFEPVAEAARQIALGVLFIEIANINERVGTTPLQTSSRS